MQTPEQAAATTSKQSGSAMMSCLGSVVAFLFVYLVSGEESSHLCLLLVCMHPWWVLELASSFKDLKPKIPPPPHPGCFLCEGGRGD